MAYNSGRATVNLDPKGIYVMVSTQRDNITERWRSFCIANNAITQLGAGSQDGYYSLSISDNILYISGTNLNVTLFVIVKVN